MAIRPGTRKKILTKIEAQALAYQSQGSNPAGLKNVRSHTLRSTLKFADLVGSSQASLFGDVVKGSNRWDTNMLTGNGMPNGQAHIVNEIRFWLSTPRTGDSAGLKTFDQDVVNSFADFMRNALFTFGREGAQWDAQFLGIEMLPALFGMVNATAEAGAAAPVRIGDFVKPALAFRLKVPVVLGSNSNFNFTVEHRTGLTATNPLVAQVEDMVVGLSGILTKISAV